MRKMAILALLGILCANASAAAPQVQLSATAEDSIVSLKWSVTGCDCMKVTYQVLRMDDQTLQSVLVKTIYASDLNQGNMAFTDYQVENGIQYTYWINVNCSSCKTTSNRVTVSPESLGWPMFKRNVLHENSYENLNIALPLGEKWRVHMSPLPGAYGFTGYQEAISVGGTVYAASLGGDIVACKAATGEIIWKKQGYISRGSSPVYDNGLSATVTIQWGS